MACRNPTSDSVECKSKIVYDRKTFMKGSRKRAKNVKKKEESESESTSEQSSSVASV